MSCFGPEILLMTESKCIVDERQQTRSITATVLTRSGSFLRSRVTQNRKKGRCHIRNKNHCSTFFLANQTFFASGIPREKD
jgi:hypothetical protein